MSSGIEDPTGLLTTLYDSLCNAYFDEGVSIQDTILKYLQDPDCSLNYKTMDNAISLWLSNITLTLHGEEDLDSHSTTLIPVPGLRVQVYQMHGNVKYDSFLKEGYKNIGHGFRSYIIGCHLSPDGVSTFKKYNKDTHITQLFLAMRQGTSPNNSLGMIIIGLDI